jgi:hypothetical protein
MELPTGGQAKEYAQTISMEAVVKGRSGGGREREIRGGLMGLEQELVENGGVQETIAELIGEPMARRCSMEWAIVEERCLRGRDRVR